MEIRGLRHSYGPNEVLKNLSLELGKGEILGLIGENGAGKSTLVKCVTGMIKPTAGTIVRAASVAAIHQELNIAGELPVFANFFLGRETTRAGFLSRRAMAERARNGLGALGIGIDPYAPASTLGASEKQMLEIARALDVDAGILILDEPTALLNADETNRLFAIMRSLRAKGTAMIYISHRLGEISQICDRVAVLRDGELRGVFPTSSFSPREMAESMVGRPLENIYPKMPEPETRTAFSFFSPSIGSFSVRAGEVLGIAGLAGSGQLELGEIAAGFRKPEKGTEIVVDGTPVSFHSPEMAASMGVGFLSPDRLASGIWRDFSIAENIALGSFGKVSSHGFASYAKIADEAERSIGEFSIRCRGASDAVSALSGGNQQKVSLAKTLQADPKAVFLNEPTQGVDVGARQEIYSCLASLAAKGVALMVISSDMTELLGLCRRILVMREGRIAGELSGARLRENEIIRLATGT